MTIHYYYYHGAFAGFLDRKLVCQKNHKINLAVLGLGLPRLLFVSSQILEKLVHISWFCILKKTVVLPSCRIIRLSISSMAALLRKRLAMFSSNGWRKRRSLERQMP